MSQKEKLWARVRQSPNNCSFDYLVRLAEYHGFVRVRQKGSHILMKHWEHPLMMNFQNRNGKAKPYQVHQLLNAINDHDL